MPGIHHKQYGWRREYSRPRPGELTFSLAVKPAAALPPAVDLRAGLPFPVYDQGQLGSCVANAVASQIRYARIKTGVTDFPPSRLMMYWNARRDEGTVGRDVGCSVRDATKDCAIYGAAHESLWPYDITRFAVRPPPKAVGDGAKHGASHVERVNNGILDELLTCLAGGWPFVFGIAIFSSFESDDATRTGNIPMPAPADAYYGGHALICVGYDQPSRRFAFRNSWGGGWGNAGHGTIPFDYLLNTSWASDFWVVRQSK